MPQGFEDLLADFLDAELTLEDLTSLAEQVRHDDRRRVEFRRMIRLHAAAREVALELQVLPLSNAQSTVDDERSFGQDTPAIPVAEAAPDQPVVSLHLKPRAPTGSEEPSNIPEDKVVATILCVTPDLVRARCSRYVWGALAACLAGLLGGAIWHLSSRTEPFQARFEARGEGVTAQRSGKTVRVTGGWSAKPGDVIRTTQDSNATLRFENEDTSLTLRGEAELAIGRSQTGKRLELNHGALAAVVDKQPYGAPLVCVTPHATITVLGTRFFVTTDTDVTRVVVREGKVRVTEHATQTVAVLAAGQLAIAASQTPLQVKSFETAPQSLLPPGWLGRDVGSVGLPGRAVFDTVDGTFTITGSGTDIWSTSDEFRYVYQGANGDCEIVARVTSVEYTHPWAKAGVMIRETLNADSTHATVVVTPGQGVSFQHRTSTGGTSAHTTTWRLTAPYWTRVVRSGNTFTGYRSPDGVTWTEVGSETITMASSVYIGLPVTSHNDGVLCTATFDNVLAVP